MMNDYVALCDVVVVVSPLRLVFECLLPNNDVALLTPMMMMVGLGVRWIWYPFYSTDCTRAHTHVTVPVHGVPVPV